MLGYRLDTVKDFLWEFKPVLSYSKPHVLNICWRIKREKTCIFSLQPGHLEADSKVKRSKIKKKGMTKREL